MLRTTYNIDDRVTSIGDRDDRVQGVDERVSSVDDKVMGVVEDVHVGKKVQIIGELDRVNRSLSL